METGQKTDIKSMYMEDLQEFVKRLGEKKYRASRSMNGCIKSRQVPLKR